MSSVPHVVVLGSINMDLVIRCAILPRPGETVIASSSMQVCGGKGANQAIAAARLGGRVSMIGRVGDDSFARRLLQNLDDASIDTTSVQRTSDCSSGLAVVAVEDSAQNSILVVPGSNSHMTPDSLRQYEHLIRSADVLVCQLELPLETVQRGVAIARENNVKVILNPAPAAAVFPNELFQVNLICPNQHEASTLLQQDVSSFDDAKKAVQQFVSRGAENAIITLGSDGAVVSDGLRTEWIPPFVIQPVDTTAAGDAFAGAMAVYWLQLGDIFQAARYASAAGAVAASREGAQPSLPTRGEIELFLNT